MTYLTQLKNVVVNDEYTSGYSDSAERALETLKAYECATNSKFVCIKKPSLFGKKGKTIYH